MKEPDPQESPDWTAAREGISLMSSDDPAILRRALACFDESIALREALLSSNDSGLRTLRQAEGLRQAKTLRQAQGVASDRNDPWPRYNLAGSWINKADVLAKLVPRPPAQQPSADDEALHACDRALEVLGPLPASGDPRFRRRHALAWLRRGERLAQAGSLAAARESAAKAIALIASAERDEIEDALLSLKARLLFCLLAAAQAESCCRSAAAGGAARLETLGGQPELLTEQASRGRAAPPGADAPRQASRGPVFAALRRGSLCAADATAETGEGRGLETASTGDAAEHSLALASHWGADRRAAPFAREFFRIGAEAYALRQPQFLGEYLREWQPFVAEAAGAASASAIAQAARALAFSRVANRALATLDQSQFDRTLASLRALRM